MMRQVTDEGTAGRSLEGKMLPRAKHMGLLENMRAVKDRIFQMGVQTNYTTWSKETFAKWTATAQTQTW